MNSNTKESEAKPPGAVSRLSVRTFSALKYRDFRLLLVSGVGSGFGQQAEIITRSWLILQLTDSAAIVGLSFITRAIGQLAIVPTAGVLGDRIDRRFLLIAADAVNIFFFILIGLLVVFNAIVAWHVVASATVAGAAMSVQQTMRQAVIPTIVPKDGIMNASGLSSVMMGTSRIMGPALAGLMIKLFGVQGSYFALAAVLVIPLVMYLIMKPIQIASNRARETFFGSLKGGFQFAIRNPAVRVVFIVNILTVTLALPFLLMMPVYVKDVLNAGPGTLGLLVSLPGFLTLAGGLFAASLGDYKYKGRLILAATLSPCVAAVILSQTNLLWLAFIGVSVHGALSPQYMAASQSAVMKSTPREMQGRAASMVTISGGLGSLGPVLYGVVADFWDIQTALFLFGGLCAILLISYFAMSKEFRQLS